MVDWDVGTGNFSIMLGTIANQSSKCVDTCRCNCICLQAWTGHFWGKGVRCLPLISHLQICDRDKEAGPVASQHKDQIIIQLWSELARQKYIEY